MKKPIQLPLPLPKGDKIVNKSLLTNLISAFILAGGYFLENNLLKMIGLFALSGALTNWLAIHMLFEKIPGLVGSGVIPKQP